MSGLNTSAENHQNSLRKEGGHSAARKDDARGRHHDKRPSPPTPPELNCTLYGIFQLSSCQVCNDGITPTANVCGIPCSSEFQFALYLHVVVTVSTGFGLLLKLNYFQLTSSTNHLPVLFPELLDDSIQDDISCLLKTPSSLG